MVFKGVLIGCVNRGCSRVEGGLTGHIYRVTEAYGGTRVMCLACVRWPHTQGCYSVSYIGI